ncbi:LysR family transcriptional regulator [Hoeflea prorocentri]|uniref:LysR family transcriptional regulator n=1 Tax=Hoeflea prorocentri TaxID=1922333 RepID=A0A9X3ZIH2_9HYPH|nr:LysR family transcriptional regulator [Hoeflea prorocentri]MCY6381841.1 LysR family transcriptional regulator [Hoeflea prorocentri]MDA5399641.1 LysR family transcriptional regulator [Hoeflea prorocentri]
MKLTQLEYLVVVAKEGSFTRAASVLSVAQPAISQQLRALETELETKLFHRTQKGATLTRAGTIMHDHAEHILNRIDVARMDIASQSEQVVGKVSLHINNAMAVRLLPLLIKELDKRYPQIELRATPLPSHQVQLNVENGRADVGVLPDRENLSKVNAKRISKEPLFFLCDPAHPAAQNTPDVISLADAMEYPMVSVPKGQPFRNDLELQISSARLPHEVRFESDELLMIFSHVNSGSVCSILPRCAVLDKIKAGTITARRIVEPGVDQDYLVAWPKSLPLSRASSVVRDVIVQLGEDGLG